MSQEVILEFTCEDKDPTHKLAEISTGTVTCENWREMYEFDERGEYHVRQPAGQQANSADLDEDSI